MMLNLRGISVNNILLLLIGCLTICYGCQVTATVDDKNPLDQEAPPRVDGLNHLLASHISSKASKLALTTDDKLVS